MNRDEALTHLRDAAHNGTLMTPKHDPNHLGTIYAGYRAVLSFEVANNLENFIDTGDFKIIEYQNARYPASPIYLELQPNANTNFSIPASGVPSYSPMATTALDRLIAVSGVNLGWHLFGESSAIIEQKVTAGDLLNRTEL